MSEDPSTIDDPLADAPWTRFLEAELPPWGAIAGPLLAGALGARGAVALGAGAEIAVATAAAALVALVCRADGRLGDLLVSLVPFAVFGWVGTDALGLRTPFEPFSVRDAGASPLLVARLFVLFIGVSRIRGPRGPIALTLLSALLLVSLAVRALVVVDLLATILVVRLVGRETLPRRRASNGLLAVVLALSSLPLVVPRHPTTMNLPPRDNRTAVAYWRERGNLYHARTAALAWAKSEAVPGAGYLELAAVDWDLGEHDKAHKVLAKALARTESPDLRRRAEALAEEWSR